MKSRASAGPAPERPKEDRATAAPKGPGGKGKPGQLAIPMPDPVNEQVVIAAAIVDVDQRKKLLAFLPSDSFFAAGHAEAWEVIGELERRGLTYDPATVQQLSNGKVDAAYLDSLIEQRPVVPPNLSHHVDVLRWDRARVEGIRGPVQLLLDGLRDPLTPAETIRASAKKIAGAFDGYGTQRFLRDPVQLKRSVMEGIRKRRAGHAVFPVGLPGFDIFGEGDPLAGQWRLIPGLAPGKLSVVTGVPGSCKTTVTSQIALAQVDYQRRVLYGAWEQGAELTMELMASQSLGISRTSMSTGQITDEQEAAIEVEIDRLTPYVRFCEVPFGRERGQKIINDRSLDLLHEMIGTSGADVAIFDLWRRALGQLDPDEEEQALYRQQAIGQETQCHQILLHQLRMKDVESRDDKRPTRESIKGSGAWIEVPDNIFGIHRDALFKDVPDNILQIHVMKQRFAKFPLVVDFDYDGDRGWLTNGRSASYERPGQSGTGAHGSGLDSFLEAGPTGGHARTKAAAAKGGARAKKK